MKLLAVDLGSLFAVTLAGADEIAAKMPHIRLNASNADIKQNGIFMHCECTGIQFEL